MSDSVKFLLWSLQVSGLEVLWSASDNRLWRVSGCDGQQDRLRHAIQGALMLAIASSDDPFIDALPVGFEDGAMIVRVAG